MRERERERENLYGCRKYYWPFKSVTRAIINLVRVFVFFLLVFLVFVVVASGFVSCFTSTETIRTIKDRESRGPRGVGGGGL